MKGVQVNSLGIWWDKRMPTGQISGHCLRWRSVWSWFVLTAYVLAIPSLVFVLVLAVWWKP